MAKSVEDFRQRLTTLERLFRRYAGPDTSVLSDDQLAAYNRHAAQFEFDRSGMDEDAIAAEAYRRISNPDSIPLRRDVAEALGCHLGCHVAPLPAAASDDAARAAYERVLEQWRE